MATVAFDVFGALGSCMGCMVAVEGITIQQPGAMNLMTFATFLTIAFIGLVKTKRFFTVENKIPAKGYLWVVSVFFIVNVVNNQALNFHGSLLASLLLEVIWRGRRYSLRKYLAVFAITVGIIICTLATKHLQSSEMSYEQAAAHFREWLIGIGMLVFVLFASAFLAIKQSEMYQKYGKHPDEAMFVTHFYSLPFFVVMWSDIAKSAAQFSNSANFTLAGVSLGVPSLWVTLVAACALQYLCIYYVYNLNATVEPLTVTLVVTLRKFLSLIVSIVVYQNPFTLMHWIGTSLVFGGTIFFDDVFFKQAAKDEKKKQ